MCGLLSTFSFANRIFSLVFEGFLSLDSGDISGSLYTETDMHYFKISFLCNRDEQTKVMMVLKELSHARRNRGAFRGKHRAKRPRLLPSSQEPGFPTST